MTVSTATTTVMTGDSGSVLMIDEGRGYTYKIEVLPHPAGPYTFSIWVYPFESEEPSEVTQTAEVIVDFFGERRVYTLEQNVWQRLVIVNKTLTGNDTEKYILLIPVDNCTFYFHKAMMEQGFYATDWKAAPEDMNENVYELTERVSRAEQKITDNAIVSTVMTSETYRNAIQELNDTMTNIVESRVTQTDEQIRFDFSQTTTKAQDAYSYVQEASGYQTFDTSGITLGKSDSPFKAKLTNTELSFMENESKVAYIDNSTMHITNAEILSTMRIGKFAFVPTDTGMALIYVGDQE